MFKAPHTTPAACRPGLSDRGAWPWRRSHSFCR